MKKAAQIQIEGMPTFRGALGKNILCATLHEEFGFPHDCNSGGRGSCEFGFLKGEITEGWVVEPSLSSRSRSRGVSSACQSGVAGDRRIKARLKPALAPVRLATRRVATLLSRNALTKGMAEYGSSAEETRNSRPGIMRCCASPLWMASATPPSPTYLTLKQSGSSLSSARLTGEVRQHRQKT